MTDKKFYVSIFGLFFIVVVGICIVGYYGIEQRKLYTETCENKGGIVLATKRKLYCLDRKVFVE